jgi:predicted RNase H-like HicB family nuclease
MSRKMEFKQRVPSSLDSLCRFRDILLIHPRSDGSAENAMKRQLTAIIEREGAGYVALCPELDIASQGDTIQEARDNLREALELFFEVASDEEVEHRLRAEVHITQVEVRVG